MLLIRKDNDKVVFCGNENVIESWSPKNIFDGVFVPGGTFNGIPSFPVSGIMYDANQIV
jgi:hypothetical protein